MPILKGEKKQALAQFHRARILSAAGELFGERGEANVTVDDIARAAGYSKATLYVYFKNRDEIVGALTLLAMRRLRGRLAMAAAEDGGWETRFKAVCRTVAAFHEEEPLAFAAAAGPINVALGDPATPQVYRDIFAVGEEINALLAAFLERGREAGVVRAGLNARRTVFTLWGALAGIVRMAGDKREYLERHLGVTRDAFLNGSFDLLLAALHNVPDMTRHATPDAEGGR